MPAERVMIFIDGSNFYHNLKAHGFGTNINYKQFSDLLCGDRTLIRTYYYNAPVDQKEDTQKYKRQQTFFNALRRTAYLELTLGRLEKRNRSCSKCGQVENYFVEKGVDVNLAVDMLSKSYRNQLDVAILVSADGDFASACQEVKELGKHVEVAHFEKGYSWKLLDVCDRAIMLDRSLIEQCYIQSM